MSAHLLGLTLPLNFFMEFWGIWSSDKGIWQFKGVPDTLKVPGFLSLALTSSVSREKSMKEEQQAI